MGQYLDKHIRYKVPVPTEEEGKFMIAMTMTMNLKSITFYMFSVLI